MSKDIVQQLIDLSMCADDSSPADASMLVQAAGEIERLRLTESERAAIAWYAGYGRDGLHADTLRELLERTK